MPLKLSLKPGEKFVLNGAVLVNGDRRATLVIQNKACMLREKEIMQPKDAKTPARRVYLAIMMMYLDGEVSEEPYNEFALRMTEFMSAIQIIGRAGRMREYQPGCGAGRLLQGADFLPEIIRI